MGLDTVEMVMDIEERFDISIPDSEAAGIRTVGDLCDMVERLVAARTEAGGPPTCLTSIAFFRLRRGLTDVCRAERKQIAPAARLEELIARVDRRRLWRELSDRTGLNFPQLYHPDWCWFFGFAFAVLLAASFWFAFLTTATVAVLSGATLGLLIAGFWLFERMTRPWEVQFGEATLTCGDLARELASKNFARLHWRGEAIRGEELWQAVVQTVCESAGVHPTKITRSTRFVEDLAMD